MPRTIEGQTAALRFLFVKTLRRSYLPDQIPFPKCHKRLPTVLSQEEVTKLIDSAGSLMHRAMIMTLYATGVRRAELCRLKVSDIDSGRMVVHIQQGKGGRDRDVPLSPKLLEILREYWRWMKPQTYLFPGMENNWRADVPITEKVVWTAVTIAAKRASIDISNHRLVAFKEDSVSFRWKDYVCRGKQKVMTLSADEFLRRFLIHVLPRGLVRIRHFGLFANRRRAASLLRCRALLGTMASSQQPAPSSHTRCSVCSGDMLIIERMTGAQLHFRSALILSNAPRHRLDSS